MRHLLPTVLCKGEAPTVMNAIMLSFEVSASHGNCFPLSYEMAVPATTPPHGRGGSAQSQHWVTWPPHGRAVIHNQKRTRFRPWCLQSKHLPPVLTAPHALLTLFRHTPPPPPATLLSQSRHSHPVIAESRWGLSLPASPQPIPPPEITGSAGAQCLCVTV